MKVYIVKEDDWGYEAVKAICSTREGAKAQLDECKKASHLAGYWVEEWEVDGDCINEDVERTPYS